MTVNPIAFGILLAISVAIFSASLFRRISLVRLGAPDDRLDRIPQRFARMIQYALVQKKVLARPFGINHALIFWSFLILLGANGVFVLEGLIPGFSLEQILPSPLFPIVMGAFDIASLVALGAVVVAFARRLFFKPDYLDSRYVKGRSFEGFLILTFIALLMLAFFVMNGALISLLGESRPFMPVSTFVGKILSSSPIADRLFSVANGAWWVHAGVLCAFICFLPISKHMHILTAIPNCFFATLDRKDILPREEFVPGNRFGVEKVTDFTWKDLLDSFSCTECGRCQDACPAYRTGKSLNPRQVVHTLKTNLLANASAIRKGVTPPVPLINGEGEGTNTEATIWGCTTCGACIDKCPVLIEQMPKIIKMRRYLVEMEARFPEELLNLFENMEQRSNPWGIAPSERTKWTSTRGVKPFESGTTEYLFYVGCAGAFDSRTKQVTVALASILDAAGISWGILGRDEKCCGDSARRLGNEYLFDRMAQENVAFFREKGVSKIITLCPHCFSTLSTDYRQYGFDGEVLHHTVLIQRLLAEGKITPKQSVDGLGTILYHDSCYLGRHNDIYDEPRRVISTVTGAIPSEFGRQREDSFCCGAGGGRMWMEEHEGERINQNRVKEAIRLKADTVCVACPYCMTMFEDGVKESGGGNIRVRDIAEIVADSLSDKSTGHA